MRHGSSPDRDKPCEGDRCTPAGEFTICTRKERSRFHLFLGLSYPDPAHAEVALGDGRITREQFDAIVVAHHVGRRPPLDTPLGGEVGIHGGGTGSDWKLGCIALSNDDVEVLWSSLPLGSRVTILP